MEDAGHNPLNLLDAVALYADATTSTYLLFHLLPQLAVRLRECLDSPGGSVTKQGLVVP